eukprot:1188561-Prorocentrum_minimum.AAC.1
MPCDVNMLKLTTGEMALAFNDFSDSQVTQTVINKGRKRLRVALSCDDGDQWATIAEVEAGHPKYYFHYPTLVQVRVLTSYTHLHASIDECREESLIAAGLEVCKNMLLSIANDATKHARGDQKCCRGAISREGYDQVEENT